MANVSKKVPIHCTGNFYGHENKIVYMYVQPWIRCLGCSAC